MTLCNFLISLWIIFYVYSIASLCFSKKGKRIKRFLGILFFAFLVALIITYGTTLFSFLLYILLLLTFLYLNFYTDFTTLFFFLIHLYFIRFLFEELFFTALIFLQIKIPSSSTLFLNATLLTLFSNFWFRESLKEKLTKTYFFEEKYNFYKSFFINGIFTLILLFHLPMHGLKKISLKVILFFLLLFNTTLLWLREKEKNKILEQKLKNALEGTESAESLLLEYKSFLHEYKNKLIIIKSLVKPKNKELHTYIDAILEEKATHKYRWLMELKTIPFVDVKGLINFKLLKMQELEIEVEMYVTDEIAKLNKDFLNVQEKNALNTILGIILDNATEGSLESKEKLASFQIYKEEEKIVILVANTFKCINIDRLEEKGFSTKGKNRGLGLHILNDLLKQNKIFAKETSIMDNFFVQKIIIQKKK